MEGETEKENNSSMNMKKKIGACDVEALKKCLEENKGDYLKCQSHIEAFKSSCSTNNNHPNTKISSPDLTKS